MRVQTHLRLALRLAALDVHLKRHQRGRGIRSHLDANAADAADTAERDTVVFVFHARALFVFARADRHPAGDARGRSVVVVGAAPPRAVPLLLALLLAARAAQEDVLPLPAVVRGVEVRERGAHLERRVHGREVQRAVAHRADAVPLARGRLRGHERATVGAQVRRRLRVDVALVRRLAFRARELDLQLAALGLVPHGVHVLDVVRPVRGAQRVLKHAQRLVRRARAVEEHGDATHDAAFFLST